MSIFRKLDNRHARFADPRKQHAMHIFDRNVLILLLVILAALAVTNGRAFDLHGSVTHGHALWFLLLPAYPLLGILGVFNAIFHVSECGMVRYFVESNPALGLALLDLVTLGIVWILIHRRGLRWFGASGVRAAANFVLILYAWGVFQLMLTGVTMLNASGAPDKAPTAQPAAAEDAKP